MMSRDTPRGFAATAALLAALGVTSAAHATSEQDRGSARQELTQAQDLKKQGQLPEALAHFEESQRLDPKLTTLMELGDCEEQLGKLIEAQAHFAEARDKAAHDELPQSKAKAELRRAAVEKRLAHLTLQLPADAPPGAQVFRDDALLEAASLGTPLLANPGDHVIVVKAPEHDDAKYNVKLAEGDNQTLPIAAGPAIAKAAKAAPPPPPPVAAPPKPNQDEAPLSAGSGSSRRTLGIVAGSVGIVGVGFGSVLWSVGYRGGNSLGPDADRQLLAGQILVIGGGALLITGIVLFATAPSGEASKNAGLKITPTLSVGRGATVLGAAGAF
jgi:hypothetical protein